MVASRGSLIRACETWVRDEDSLVVAGRRMMISTPGMSAAVIGP